MPAVLALASALTYGIADFLGGLATRKAAVVAITLITNIAGGALIVVLAFLIDGEWSTQAVAWGAAGGVCGLTGVVMLYQGLASGPNRLVSPLSAVVAAVVPICFGLLLGDRPGGLALLGLAIAPVAIWLVAGGDARIGDESKRPLAFGVSAGIGFGLSFVLLAQAPDDAGVVPLISGRALAFTVLVIAALVTKPSVPARPVIGLAIVAGLFDMSANAFFLWSTLDGELSIVGALVSLFPAPTVLLAVAFLGECLDRKQTAGLALALVTAALLS